MDTHTTLSSEACVSISQPRRYLAQLCKHFQHRLPVTLEEDHGRIEFAGGACALEATAETLLLHVTAEGEAALTRCEEVVARHLLRFAFREPPEIRWTRSS